MKETHIHDQLRALAKDEAAYEALKQLYAAHGAPVDAEGRCVFVRQGRVQEVQEQAAQLIGTTAAQLRGTDVINLFGDVYSPTMRIILDKLALNNGETLVSHVYLKDRPLTVEFSLLHDNGDVPEMRLRLLESQEVMRHSGSQADFCNWMYAASHPTFFLDASFCVRVWNGAAQQLFGISEAQAQGQYAVNVFDIERLKPSFKELVARLEAQRNISEPIHISVMGGGVHHVHLDVAPQTTSAGIPAGFVVQMRPLIPPQTEASVPQLTWQNPFFIRMIDYLPAAVSLKDAEGVYLASNTAFRTFLGKPQSEVLGKKDVDIIANEDTVNLLKAQDQQVLRTGQAQVYNLEDYEVRPGLHFDFNMRKLPVSLPDGTQLILSIAVDVTAQSRHSREVLQTEAFFRSILNALPFSVTVTDKEGHFLLVNRHTLQEMGKSEAEVLGRHYTQVAPPEVEAQLQSQLIPFKANFEQSLMHLMHYTRNEKAHTSIIGQEHMADLPGYGSVNLSFVLDVSSLAPLQTTVEQDSELLRSAIDASPNIIYLRDANGRFLMANLQLLTLLQQPLEHVMQPDYQVPPQFSAFLGVVPEVLSHSQSIQQEEGLDIGDNEMRWFQIRKIPLRLRSGALVQLGIAADITKRVVAEGEILRKTAELQAIFQALPDLYLRIDQAGIFQDFYSATKSEFYPFRNRMLHKHIHDVLPTRVSSVLYRALLKVNSEQRRARIEFMLGKRYFECRIIPFFGTEVVAVVRNITQPKQTEIALRNSEEKYRTVVENVREVFFQTDAQGKLIYLNGSWHTSLGYPVEGSLGLSLSAYVHPSDLELLKKFTNYVLDQQGGSFRAELRLRNRWGAYRWMDFQTAFTKLPAGMGYGLTGTLNDITERKVAEDNLLRTKLEAEAATRAKSDFLATVSHELRTPLNGIIGTAQLMAQTPLNEEQQDNLDTLRVSSETLLQLINDLLDFSKIESGNLELNQKHFQLSQMLHDSLDLLQNRAFAENVQLSLHAPPSLPNLLVGDALRIRQVLVNLVDNAIKFSKGGRVRVEVQALPTSDEGVELRFLVSDTGIGIPHSKQQRIFEPFIQADSTTTRQYGGTGLGLAISSRLAELMGGDLSVESTVGKGSTFTFCCPLPRVSEQDAQPPAGLSGLHVLVLAQPSAACDALLAYMADLDVTVLHLTDWASFARLSAEKKPSHFILGVSLWNVLAGELPLSTLPDKGILWRDARMRPGLSGHQSSLKGWPTLPYLLCGLDLVRALTGTTPARPTEAAAMPHNGTLGPYPNSPHAERPKGSMMQVLVAEDNPINQKLIRRMLQHLGHDCILVNNGEEAIHAVSLHPVDVVLMDIQMPVLDGMKATAQIRALAHCQHLPIVAMTANVTPGFEEACLAVGMTAYLSKPVHIEDLQTLLAQYVADNLQSKDA